MQPAECVAETGGLKIGAVARLTGLSVHTLRKWEDRYSAVSPKRRPGGERVYTRTDLKRLALIKGLAQAGMPLAEVASLPLQRLETAREGLAQNSLAFSKPLAHVTELNVAVVGDALPALVARQQGDLDKFNILGCADTVDALHLPVDSPAIDIVILECAVIDPSSCCVVDDVLAKTRAMGIVIVYGFAARRFLRSLRGSNVALMRGPVDASELQRTVLGLSYDISLTRRPTVHGTRRSEDEIPPRRLSKEAIARIASTVPRVQCECPHHLADLLFALRAFEDYSASCENRNPTDAALHHYLWATTAEARSNFEDAILRVAESEGISLSEADSPSTR